MYTIRTQKPEYQWSSKLVSVVEAEDDEQEGDEDGTSEKDDDDPASQEEKSQSQASQSAQSKRKRPPPTSPTQLQAAESPPKKPHGPPSHDEGTDAVAQHGKPVAPANKQRSIPKTKESQATAIQQGLTHKRTFATLVTKRVKPGKEKPVQRDPALEAVGKFSEQLFGELGTDSDSNADLGVLSGNDDDREQERPKSKNVLPATPGVGTEAVPPWAAGGSKPDPILQHTFKMLAENQAAEEAKIAATKNATKGPRPH